MNELGLPITLIILTQYQRTDLSLLELSAAAGPGVDLRLRGRPGLRRAGLRDVSSFLQRGRQGGGGGGWREIKDAVRTAGEIRKKLVLAIGQTALGMSRQQVLINQADAA